MTRMNKKFNVITLCGSPRFELEFWDAALELMKQDYLVLMPKIFFKQDRDNLSKQELAELELNQKQKIDISDAILVINRDGYIEKEIEEQIQYAKSRNKRIQYRYMYCKDDCAYRMDCFAKKRLIGFVPDCVNSECPECIYYCEEGI